MSWKKVTSNVLACLKKITEEVNEERKIKPYIVFEGVFRGDAVNLFNCIRGNIQARRLAVIDHQELVIFLIGCKIQSQ